MKSNNRKEQTIIFLHIPKTGGVTLHSIIDNIYPVGNIYTIDPAKDEKPLKKLKKLPHEEKRNIKVLRGHMGFGRHEVLPQTCTYITMLRDPVDRIISHYYYVLQTLGHELHERVKLLKMDLKEYVTSGISRELNNGQTRVISGLKSDYHYGENPQERLMTAKNNLRKYFSVIGLTEKYEETLILLKREFGWDWPFYRRVNVTKGKVARENIPASTIETIREYNQLDIELYDYAMKLFDEKICEQDESFFPEVEKFKKLNKINEDKMFHNENKPVKFLRLKRKVKGLLRV